MVEAKIVTVKDRSVNTVVIADQGKSILHVVEYIGKHM